MHRLLLLFIPAQYSLWLTGKCVPGPQLYKAVLSVDDVSVFVGIFVGDTFLVGCHGTQTHTHA